MSADVQTQQQQSSGNHPAGEQLQHHHSQASQSGQVHAEDFHHATQCTSITCLLKRLPLCPLWKVLSCTQSRIRNELQCAACSA